jgi:hypothetical protein
MSHFPWDIEQKVSLVLETFHKMSRFYWDIPRNVRLDSTVIFHDAKTFHKMSHFTSDITRNVPLWPGTFCKMSRFQVGHFDFPLFQVLVGHFANCLNFPGHFVKCLACLDILRNVWVILRHFVKCPRNWVLKCPIFTANGWDILWNVRPGNT